MNITLKTVPLSGIRNQQAGDWKINPDGSLEILAPDSLRQDHSFLILIHELIECYLCKRRRITDEEVTAFDALFEEERLLGKHSAEDENGDDPRAPYAAEHFVATNIERQIARELSVQWNEYEDAIEALFPEPQYNSGPMFNVPTEGFGPKTKSGH